MRGIGCLLTGIELFARQHSGRLRHRRPAGRRGISIDQEIKNYLQKDPATKTRLRLAGTRRDGAGVAPTRWTRWSYAGAPTSRSPRLMTRTNCSSKLLHGRARTTRRWPAAGRHQGRLEEGCERMSATGGQETAGRTRDLRARHGKELKEQKAASSNVGHAVPKLEPGLKRAQRKHAADFQEHRSNSW